MKKNDLRLWKIIDRFFNLLNRKVRHNLMMLAAILVVFSVTYALILPVITLDRQKSQSLPGFRLEGGTSSSEKHNAPEDDNTGDWRQSTASEPVDLEQTDYDQGMETSTDQDPDKDSTDQADFDSEENPENSTDSDLEKDSDNQTDHSVESDSSDRSAETGKTSLPKLVCERDDFTAAAIFEPGTKLPEGMILRVDELKENDINKTLTGRYRSIYNMTGNQFASEYPKEKMAGFRLYEVQLLSSDGKQIDQFNADLRIVFKKGILMPDNGRAITVAYPIKDGSIHPVFVEKNRTSVVSDLIPEVVTISQGKVDSLNLTDFHAGDEFAPGLVGLVASSPRKQEGKIGFLEGIQEKKGKDYAVSVDVPKEAAIPKDAKLYVKPIKDTDPYMKLAKKELEGEEILTARFFDIGFTVDGKEIEPACPVDVTIKITEKTDGKVLHFSEDGPEVLDAENVTEETKGQEDYGTAVNFQADGFSIYGIVETTLEKTFLTSDGQNYRVTVTYGADAEIPEGAELSAEEILPGDRLDNSSFDKYEDYVDQIRNTLGWADEYPSYLRLFDIKILDESGEKVEIAAPVDVTIDLVGKESTKEAEDSTQVIHFADGTKTGDLLKNVSVEGETVQFTASGFSAYAIVDGPSGVSANWHKVQTIDELMDHAASGLYIGHTSGYYFTDKITNSNFPHQ